MYCEYKETNEPLILMIPSQDLAEAAEETDAWSELGISATNSTSTCSSVELCTSDCELTEAKSVTPSGAMGVFAGWAVIATVIGSMVM